MPVEMCFSTAQNNFWICWFQCLLVLLLLFVSPLYIGTVFPFEGFSQLGKQIEVAQCEIQWIRRVGHRGHAIFGQKLLNVLHGVGRCTCKSPSWNGQTHWNGLQKKFTDTKCSLSQHYQLVHWYRWVPGTLTQQGKPVCTTGGRPPEDGCVVYVPFVCYCGTAAKGGWFTQKKYFIHYFL